MNGKIFVDTSAWLAYSIPKDPYHKEFTRLFNENESVQTEAFALAEKYKDHKLSLTDISSAVLMKNFHITTIFTLDSKHFATFGFKALPIV